MGFVRVEVDVEPDGTVVGVRKVSGHPLLVPSVEQMAKQLLFEPLRESGRPVGFTYVQEVTFRLEDAVVRQVQPRNTRQECRWRDEDMERAVACLESLADKTTEEYLSWAEMELWRGDSMKALTLLEEGLPGTERRYLEVAEAEGQFEEARRRLANRR